jgi:hypothetical protein
LVVTSLIQRSKGFLLSYQEKLKEDESVLSFNKVTGFSVNFPIFGTCKPTQVCAARCYYAKGGSSWPASLKKQQRLLNSVKKNPELVAKRIVYECRKKQVTYLRWNGGGDLFPESIETLHRVAEMEPQLPIWVVTRIPEMAAEIKDYPNVYVHFSLDKASLKRRVQFESMPKKTKNYFFSYQCDKDEMPSKENLEGVSVLFFDRYELHGQWKLISKEIICPLNTREDITNTCVECRRCFDGAAVKYFNLRKTTGTAP